MNPESASMKTTSTKEYKQAMAVSYTMPARDTKDKKVACAQFICGLWKKMIQVGQPEMSQKGRKF